MQLIDLFGICLLISSISFGGGAQALFYQFAVLQMGWITGADLSAVFAFGYATPGPAVYGTAIFIGYKLGGIGGAVLGGVGIFFVPWVLSLVATSHADSLLDHPRTHYATQGMGLAAAGVVAATAISFLPPFSSMSSALYFLLAFVAFWGTWTSKVHPLFLLLLGLVVGMGIG